MRNIVLFTVLSIAANAFAADPNLGDVWYVSTESAVLRKKPDSLSKAVKTLKYKDRATIKGISRGIFVP